MGRVWGIPLAARVARCDCHRLLRNIWLLRALFSLINGLPRDDIWCSVLYHSGKEEG